jgi:hypothetical protein
MSAKFCARPKAPALGSDAVRERWLGATGVRVPEIAVEGEDLELPDDEHVRVAGTTHDALVLVDVRDRSRLEQAHADGMPVVVRAETATAVREALARPEVACAIVSATSRELRELDLTELTYG